MVADILQALSPIALPNNRHFTLNGGVRAALLAVEGHAKRGYVHAIERDIRRFYPSVNLEGLATLLQPLPGSVVMNVIGYRHSDAVYGDNHSSEADDTLPLSPRGMLAQGSASSPVAAELIMADLLRGMPEDVRIVSYADNVLILGVTLDSVRRADAVFEACASTHPCGPLGLKECKEADLSSPSGINFLGHDGYMVAGEIEWSPDLASCIHVYATIEDNALDVSTIIKKIAWLRNWRRGYLWKGGAAEVERLSVQLWARLAFSSGGVTLSRSYQRGMQEVVEYCLRQRRDEGIFPDLYDLMPDFYDAPGMEGVRYQLIRDVSMRLGVPFMEQ